MKYKEASFQPPKRGLLGTAPAIVMVNPKYPHNIGAALRAASCFGVKQVWYTGNRIKLKEGERIPREERMRGYAEVDLINSDYPFDQFGRDVTPVAIELVPGSEMLPQFEHPKNPIYVFGPEDGSLSPVIKRHCHKFVSIPTRHCTNLSAAIYITLYDRLVKQQQSGELPILPIHEVLAEERGWFPEGFDGFEDY